MTDKAIETRIRQHYVADTGEWLVEKGKVKEAKLLKEACETIERLRRLYITSEQNYYELHRKVNTKQKEFEAREKAVEEGEERLRERLAYTIKVTQQLLKTLQAETKGKLDG